MSASDKLQVTQKTILEICEKYGFTHREEEDGRHLVSFGDKEVEVKFNPDGSLPRGRNAFLGAARKASADFARDYPAVGKTSRARQDSGKLSKDDLPELDSRFLAKYSLAALEQLEKILPGILKEKKETEERRKKIEKLKNRIAGLNGVVEQTKELGCKVDVSVNDNLEYAKLELDELLGNK